SPRHTGGSGGADTASTEISPSLTCENHVQHGKQVLTSTTLIRPNTCPRMAQCPDMLVRLPPRCTQCNRTPHFFFQNHEGATPDLVPLPRRSGSRLRLIDHERVTSRPIQLKAQPGRLRCELARMRSVTMGAENDHKGVRAAIRPSPSAIRRSDPISGAAGAVSLPTRRDSLPAPKRRDKGRSSHGGVCRLLQPLLPGPQKGRELSADTRSTCVAKHSCRYGSECWPHAG